MEAEGMKRTEEQHLADIVASREAASAVEGMAPASSLDEALAILAAAGDETAVRVSEALEHADDDAIVAGMDHRYWMCMGPNPHQNIAGNRRILDAIEAHSDSNRMMRPRLGWETVE